MYYDDHHDYHDQIRQYDSELRKKNSVNTSAPVPNRRRSAPDVGVRVGSFSIAYLRRSEFRTRSRSRTELGGFSIRKLIDRLRLTVIAFE